MGVTDYILLQGEKYIHTNGAIGGVRMPLQWRHNERGGVSITSLTVVYSTV